MLKLLTLSLWRTVACITLLLGVIGVVVPGLPTVPFLLLSAWSAGKGWPRLELWLLAHPSFGPPLKRWREQGAVPRKAKYLAIMMMILVSFSFAALCSTPLAQTCAACFSLCCSYLVMAPS